MRFPRGKEGEGGRTWWLVLTSGGFHPAEILGQETLREEPSVSSIPLPQPFTSCHTGPGRGAPKQSGCKPLISKPSFLLRDPLVFLLSIQGLLRFRENMFHLLHFLTEKWGPRGDLAARETGFKERGIWGVSSYKAKMKTSLRDSVTVHLVDISTGQFCKMIDRSVVSPQSPLGLDLPIDADGGNLSALLFAGTASLSSGGTR